MTSPVSDDISGAAELSECPEHVQVVEASGDDLSPDNAPCSPDKAPSEFDRETSSQLNSEPKKAPDGTLTKETQTGDDYGFKIESPQSETTRCGSQSDCDAEKCT